VRIAKTQAADRRASRRSYFVSENREAASLRPIVENVGQDFDNSNKEIAHEV